MGRLTGRPARCEQQGVQSSDVTSDVDRKNPIEQGFLRVLCASLRVALPLFDLAVPLSELGCSPSAPCVGHPSSPSAYLIRPGTNERLNHRLVRENTAC